MHKKTKILFILHLPPPVHGSSMMGAFIKKSSLINTHFNTRYINLGTSKTIDEIGKNPVSKILTYIKILFRVCSQLVTFKPTVVYLAITARGVGFYKDMVVVLLAKLLGKVVVLHFHNKGVQQNQNKLIDNILYRFVFKNSKIILLSPHLYSDIKKYVPKSDVYYCPNGIPHHQDVLTETKPTGTIVKILFLSNLLVSKGVYVLLDALNILKTLGVAFSCDFVGGIGDITEAEFNAYRANLNLTNEVKYLGKKFDQEKQEIYKKADVFVHPTLSDCFPLVLLEASQYYLPLISTLEGAVPEIIEDNYNGFVVPKNDAGILAEKLKLLVEDEELRLKMGGFAFEKFNKLYRLSHFESNLLAILENVSLK